MTDGISDSYRDEFKGNLVRDFKEYVYTHYRGYPSPEGFVKWYNERQRKMDEETEKLRKENEKRRQTKGT